MDQRRSEFCLHCRKQTEYILKKKSIAKTVREKDYIFEITTAVCPICGEEMSVPGLIDKNIQEIDSQYRAAENLITIDEIENLMKIYKIGKAPLSLVLGFGEVTIGRYISGQIPSKDYSDIMKKALASPAFMKELLNRNREKIADTAYSKAMAAATGLENLFSVSDKMLQVIAYIFNVLEEVTPLMLQKLLYFVQGVHFALYKAPLFREDCRAWVHGPVYSEVYDMFKSFHYNPIDDARFAVLEGVTNNLTEEEKKVIDLVISTFGLYGGKTLERITHKEDPWITGRRGFADGIHSNEVMSKDSIKDYFIKCNDRFGFDTEDGLKKYIQHMLDQ
ncbi:MAG: DUF4065 domain-containing protein [Bacillota bacterium]|nr:DUF4065 domain-containing protein [Bacillota bacterium]